MADSVKVAVRVRPFNDKEKKSTSRSIVAMKGKTTALFDPKDMKKEPRSFGFDHSYWSHDGCKQQSDGYMVADGSKSKYTDQKQLFQDLGVGMLDNTWQGYNSTIFAYGQTGSGKSYSIFGSKANQGLVPRLCEELFNEIGRRKAKDKKFEVMFSMLEVYNEEVRDLLDKRKPSIGGLQVKQTPQGGFGVPALINKPVGNYNDIKTQLDIGDKQRTIAATQMNQHSSRAHTIVTVRVTQRNTKNNSTTTASINLVDLAGSERNKQTGTTGERFKESANINKSLFVLGQVIKALCDKAKGKTTPHIPYRDSVLTKLLENALGGNSKTVMIAAVGPGAENYDQTLSTLQYADRAKSIKTKAKINLEDTEVVKKQTKAEAQRLEKELHQKQLQKSISDEEVQKLKREIERYKKELKNMETSWEKRLEEAEKETEQAQIKEREDLELEKKTPHLSNLNEDPALEGRIVHWIKPGITWSVGNGKQDSNPGILITGPKIAKQHAEIVNKGGKVTLVPKRGRVLHNGKEIQGTVTLDHQDRVRFGSNNFFVFILPDKAAELRKKGKLARHITYEFALNEIAKQSGLVVSDEDSILQHEVMQLMQVTQEVNAMAEDMDKSSVFDIILVSAEARGLESGRTEVFVRVCDGDNGNEYLWDKNKFLDRQVLMQQMYQRYEEHDKVPKCSKQADPFWEPPDTELVVGIASVPLNYLSHMLEFNEETLNVIDYKAKQVGFLKVDIIPCDKTGKEDIDRVVEDPVDLVNTEICFKVKIHQALTLPDKFEKTWCVYKFNDMEETRTKEVSGKNPAYRHEKMFRIKKSQVNYQLVDYLKDKSMNIEIWGKQGERQMVKTPKQKDKESQRFQEYKKALDDIAAVATRNKNQKGMTDILKILEKVTK